MNCDEARFIRDRLGLTREELSEWLRLGPNGPRTIRRWEAGDGPISGPVSVLLEGWLDDLEQEEKRDEKRRRSDIAA